VSYPWRSYLVHDFSKQKWKSQWISGCMVMGMIRIALFIDTSNISGINPLPDFSKIERSGVFFTWLNYEMWAVLP